MLLPRLGATVVAVALGALSACGSTDTPLGTNFDPLDGAACSVTDEEQNGCVCQNDKRWLCAGQGSVTCSSTYGSGGGRLLVDVEDPCEMIWGWRGGCNDGRAYGVECDGLRCQCSVDEQPGREWFTPRCAEMIEANQRCGWSLRLPAGASMGNAPAQGYACEHEGQIDEATDCQCVTGLWDCAYAAGCRLASDWHRSDQNLKLLPDGTVDYRPLASIPRDAILSRQAPGFVGTWQLAWPNIHFRSTHSPEAPECDDTFGTYALAFTEECSFMELILVSDPCAARVAVLDGFLGRRTTIVP
jgi:hypothetical protein